MKNKFGIFGYFIDGVVSTLKFQQQDRQLQQERSNSQKVIYLKQWKRNSWFREKILQKFFVSQKVREEKEMKKSVYPRKLQNGVKRFWKGKQDYVHTG